jgi:pSer/pThr/pTyr-binding forkhead associated (FHA) protein
MDLIKLCPACGEKNPVSEIICRICMTNLSSISPVPEIPEPKERPADMESHEGVAPGAYDTIVAPPPVLTFSRNSDGRFLPVGSGYILGRDGDTGEFFKETKTVSRRHAKIFIRDGCWWIEDLSSTNGTWVNGRRIETGTIYPITTGDTVSLSMACEMKVIA